MYISEVAVIASSHKKFKKNKKKHLILNEEEKIVQ